MTSLEAFKICPSLFIDNDNKLIRYYEYIFNVIDEEYKKLNTLGYFDRLLFLDCNMIYEYIVEEDSILYTNGIYQINIEFTSLTNEFTNIKNIENSYIYGKNNIKYKIYSLIGNYSGLRLFNTQLLGCTYAVNDISGFVSDEIKLYHLDNIVYNISLESLKIKTIYTDYTSKDLIDININKCNKIYYYNNIIEKSSQKELCNTLSELYKYNLKSNGTLILYLYYKSLTKLELNKYVNSLTISLMDVNLCCGKIFIVGSTLNIIIKKIESN